MSEAANELNDAKVEEQVELETESPVEPDSEAQSVQAPAETALETAAEVAADADSEAIAEVDAETVDSGEIVAEEADAKPLDKHGVSNDSEEGESGPSVVDFVVVSICALLFGLLLCLPTFLGSSGSADSGYDLSGGVAVTVNGVEIGENDLTAYVSEFRAAQGLGDDEAWGQWIVDNGYTPEMLRSDTIEYFTTRELTKQAVKEQNIEIDESDVDAQLANIAEQIGGEDVLKEALESQGLTLESYRESIVLSLQQDALADKVTAGNEALADDTVLELMKMYFPDEVSEDTESLEGLDADLVNDVRSWLKQQAFSEWMDQYREQAVITINDMPEGLPYAVDTSAFEPTTSNLGDLIDYSELTDEAQDGEEAEE